MRFPTFARTLCARGLLAGAAALLAAPGAWAQEPVRVGAFLSVTGPAAFLGDPELKTLELYVERINAAGGVLGRKLQLVSYDDAGDAEFGQPRDNVGGARLLVGGEASAARQCCICCKMAAQRILQHCLFVRESEVHGDAPTRLWRAWARAACRGRARR